MSGVGSEIERLRRCGDIHLSVVSRHDELNPGIFRTCHGNIELSVKVFRSLLVGRFCRSYFARGAESKDYAIRLTQREV